MPQHHPEKNFAGEELLRNDSRDVFEDLTPVKQSTGPVISCKHFIITRLIILLQTRALAHYI